MNIKLIHFIMRGSQQILEYYQSDKNKADILINQKRDQMDIEFLNDIIERISDVDLNVNQKDLLCLVAKNFFHTNQPEYKLAIFGKYHQLDKQKRTANIQNILNDVNNINHGYMLLAHLLEQDATYPDVIPTHREIIKDMLENGYLNELKTLEYLIQMSSFKTISDIIQKQRGFLDNLQTILIKGGNLEILVLGTSILAKTVANLTQQTESILSFTFQIVSTLFQQQENKQILDSLNNCVCIFTEACKYRRQDTLNHLDQIYGVISNVCQKFINNQPLYSTIMINIITFFKQVDECKYDLSIFILCSYVFKLYEANITDLNVLEELNELTVQLLKHQYVAYKDQILKTDEYKQYGITDQEKQQYQELISMMNFNSADKEICDRIVQFDAQIDEKMHLFEQILDFQLDVSSIQQLNIITQLQPLYRHRNLINKLDQINVQILNYFNDITQHNFEKYSNNQVLAFIRFLNSYTTYAPQNEFITNHGGIASVIKIMIKYLDRIDTNVFFQLTNNYLNKLYVCEYNLLSSTLQSILSDIYLQIVMILKNSDKAILDILQHFNSYFLINEFLFQKKCHIYLEQNKQTGKLTKEQLTFKQGDIQTQYYYNIIMRSVQVELKTEFYISESLNSLIHVSNLVFDLMEKILMKSENHLLQLQVNSLNLLGNCVLSLNERICAEKQILTEEQIWQIFTGVLPRICTYYTRYLTEVSKFEDAIITCIDILSALSQLAALSGLNFNTQVLPGVAERSGNSDVFQVVYPSVYDRVEGILTLPGKELFVNGCVFAATQAEQLGDDDINYLMGIIRDNLLKEQLPTNVRQILNVLLGQILTFQRVPLSQELIQMVNQGAYIAVNILQHAQQSKQHDQLIVSLFSLLSAFYNYCKNQKVEPDKTSEHTANIFNRAFMYVKTATFEDIFDVDIIKLSMLSFIGVIGCTRAARNIVAKQDTNMFIKKCIGIMTGIQDDQNAERILQGFMGDYNKALQGIDLV